MARRGRPRHPDILTPREWDVLALLREGLTNDQIAQRLEITERTAKFHVSEILSKLGVSSREEAAAWQPEGRRPWWVAASTPLAFVWQKSAGGLNALGLLIAAGVVAAALAGVALLAVMVIGRDGGSSTTAPSAEPRIAFSAGGSIYTVRPDGTGLRKVIPGDRASEWNAAPALSPDGSRIAFTRDYNIWIANSDGSKPHELASVRSLQTPPGGGADNFSTGAQSIAWSPDGTRIAYVLGRIGGSGFQDLWLMNSDGSNRTELSRSGAVWEQPVWLDSDRVSVVAPGKILVFNTSGESEPAVTFVDQAQQFSLSAVPAGGETWLVGPITAEGAITLGSPDAGRKTVANGVSPALARGGVSIAYLAGDTLHVAETGGNANDQILDLAPLGGRDRFFGEPGRCLPEGSSPADVLPACSYRLPAISWWAPVNVYRADHVGLEFGYPASWIEHAADAPFRQCSDCAVFGPPNALHPHGIRFVFAGRALDGCGAMCSAATNGRVQQEPERRVTVRGRDATQAQILSSPPVGYTNQTGDDTPYYEVWTLVPVSDSGILLVAFYRAGDKAAEEETLAAYDALLLSLRLP